MAVIPTQETLREARWAANKALHAWKRDPSGGRVSTDEMFTRLQQWIDLEIDMALMTYTAMLDERGRP